MNAILRVGAHHHVWDLTVRDQPWTTELPLLRRSFGFAELRPHLQTHDVDGTVLVQTIAVAEETPELLDLATREPMMLGVVRANFSAMENDMMAGAKIGRGVPSTCHFPGCG
jgi:L-fuconolactonase